MAKTKLNWDETPGAIGYVVAWYPEGSQPQEFNVAPNEKPVDLLLLGRNPGEHIHIQITPYDAEYTMGMPSAEVVWFVPLPAPQNVRLE